MTKLAVYCFLAGTGLGLVAALIAIIALIASGWGIIFQLAVYGFLAGTGFLTASWIFLIVGLILE